ncbi:cell division protein FtsL [Hahella sp. KA22]|uniref:cell division protein FtsL n=1 Tax=Hahella sp. KA22 TaxID=1628392 RepID=UPI000FDD6953|nr:cell division protein FtsL [Hahella sp. KA22]AZZ90489.1 cell division protein FtsL [Hahella sp. KA22]QAY53859.1 cell division protein FtsL [Hahella sp. KA22]
MILIRSTGQATPLTTRRSKTVREPILPVVLEWWGETCRLAVSMVKGRALITLSLLAALVVSGVATVYAVHLNRQQFIELQTLQRDKDRYEREWTQLLLEESAWSAHSRVEQIADQRFGMHVPDATKIEIVR